MPQQTHPSWFDWITVAAIVLGPVLALFAQRALDWLREKKKRRATLYMTVMSLRGAWLHTESLRALNSIDTVFSGGGADARIRRCMGEGHRACKHAGPRRHVAPGGKQGLG
jgi:hypothetical protein